MRRLAIALAVLAPLAAAAPAQAGIDFGSPSLAGTPTAGCPLAGGCSVTDQVHADASEEKGAPTGGVLTQVRLVYAGDGANVALRVLRGEGDSFVNVGPEIPETLPDTGGARELLTFDVHHPVQEGDRLALATGDSTGDSFLAPGGSAQCLLGPAAQPDDGTTAAAFTSASCSAELLIQGTVEPDADLAVTATASPATVALDRTATFTFTVTNHGSHPADHVGLKIPIGTRAQLRSATSTAGRCGGVRAVFCWLGTLKPGASASVRVDVVAAHAGTLKLEAGATAETPDADPTDNTGETAIEVVDPFPGVHLRAQRFVVRGDTVRVRHGCPRRTPRFCKGSVALARGVRFVRAETGGPATARPRGSRLGGATFRLQAGAATRVPVELSRKARRLVLRRRRIEVAVFADAVDGAKTRRVTYARLVLVAPPRKHRHHRRHHHRG